MGDDTARRAAADLHGAAAAWTTRSAAARAGASSRAAWTGIRSEAPARAALEILFALVIFEKLPARRRAGIGGIRVGERVGEGVVSRFEPRPRRIRRVNVLGEKGDQARSADQAPHRRRHFQ